MEAFTALALLLGIILLLYSRRRTAEPSFGAEEEHPTTLQRLLALLDEKEPNYQPVVREMVGYLRLKLKEMGGSVEEGRRLKVLHHIKRLEIILAKEPKLDKEGFLSAYRHFGAAEALLEGLEAWSGKAR